MAVSPPATDPDPTPSEQDKLLAADKIIRDRGALIAAVEAKVVTLRAWDGTPEVAEGGVANLRAPLVGFSVIEAADLNEAIALVAENSVRPRAGSHRNQAHHVH